MPVQFSRMFACARIHVLMQYRNAFADSCLPGWTRKSVAKQIGRRLLPSFVTRARKSIPFHNNCLSGGFSMQEAYDLQRFVLRLLLGVLCASVVVFVVDFVAVVDSMGTNSKQSMQLLGQLLDRSESRA